MTRFSRIGSSLALLVLVATTAAMGEPEPPLGDTSGAQPGMERVALPGVESPRVSVAATGSYGFTEAQDGQDGGNHRLAGTLAVGAAPLPWLEGALRFDGRYDRHPDDSEGPDSGMVGEPRLSLRAGSRTGDFRIGADASVWLIGSEAPSVAWDATTLDLKALVGYAPAHGPTLALNVGWRLDQSANSEPEPETLRIGDRMALGLSDSHALLLGIGWRQPVGSTELLAELTGDLLMGSKAPPIGQSPLRLTAGARHWLSRRLAFSVLAEASLSGRPDLGPDDPLAPIEPRFGAHLGLRYRLGPEPEATVAPPDQPPPGHPSPDQPPKPPTEPVIPDRPPAPQEFTVTGTVVDEGGEPVPDAAVTFTMGKEALDYRTAADGSYRFVVKIEGEGRVTVESPGFDNVERKVAVAGQDVAIDEIVLRPAVPAGQLKGLIRGMDGHAVAATVIVEGTEITLETDAEGQFSADVPPGSYVIQIKADGFVGQRRRVRIENRGVTVLNVDLRKKQ